MKDLPYQFDASTWQVSLPVVMRNRPILAQSLDLLEDSVSAYFVLYWSEPGQMQMGSAHQPPVGLCSGQLPMLWEADSRSPDLPVSRRSRHFEGTGAACLNQS